MFRRAALVAELRRWDKRLVYGVHAKSVRASMDPLGFTAALTDVVRDLPGARLQVNIHHDAADDDGAHHDPVLMRSLRTAEADGALDLVVHDFFGDEELWQYLESLDLSVLPHRFRTHSGWLEACFDLGTRCSPRGAASTQQRPCLTYRHDDRGLDVPSLQAAVRTARAAPGVPGMPHGPAIRAGRAGRRAPRPLRGGAAMTRPARTAIIGSARHAIREPFAGGL